MRINHRKSCDAIFVRFEFKINEISLTEAFSRITSDFPASERLCEGPATGEASPLRTAKTNFLNDFATHRTSLDAVWGNGHFKARIVSDDSSIQVEAKQILEIVFKAKRSLK